MRTLIKNGRIVDGGGSAPFRGDVLLEDRVIREVSPKIEAEADVCYDAGGKAVTPGFIDTHRHGDIAALTDPAYGELELRQGITTVLCGNCGLAPAPMARESRAELCDYIEPCLGVLPEDAFFPTVSSYLSALERRPLRVNMGLLAATGAITVAAKGFSSAQFTGAQLQKARELVRDAMEAGAWGLSCGIMYHPECDTSEEEYAAMVSEAAPYGGYLTSHIRGEGNGLLPSIEEVLRIAKRAGVPLNVSHFKVTGVDNWGKSLPAAIAMIERARAQGMDVTADAYPYPAGSTTILSLIPPTVALEGIDTPDGVARLGRELHREHPGWDNMIRSIGWERIVISSVIRPEHRIHTGRSLAEIAEALGVSPERAMAELTAGNAGKVGVILMSMAEEDVELVLRQPWVSVISDALYGGGDCPHPRLYGAFPRMIHEYVMKRGLLPLETAVQKMTSLPARRMGLRDRGLLRPGMAADLCVFDPDELRDTATFAAPRQPACGLSMVFLNGSLALENDRITDARAGGVLRKPH